MSDEQKYYSVSDLAAELNVPRTTINDWLKKFDRYIVCEQKGKRKVYTVQSLAVLQKISALRDSGLGALELEKKLSASCAICPEPADFPEQDAESLPPGSGSAAEKSSGNLPVLNSDFKRFMLDFERRENWQQNRRRKSMLWISFLLILLLAAACTTLFLLGQLLTLRESARGMLNELADSRKAAAEIRQDTRLAFTQLQQKMENSRNEEKAHSLQLEKQIDQQKQDFRTALGKLEESGNLREQEITRLKNENTRLKEKLSQLNNQLLDQQNTAREAALIADQKLSALQQKSDLLLQEKSRQISALEKALEKALSNTGKQQPPAAAPQEKKEPVKNVQ